MEKVNLQLINVEQDLLPKHSEGRRWDWRETRWGQVIVLIISGPKGLIVETGGLSIIFSFIRQRADRLIWIRMRDMVIDRPKSFLKLVKVTK